MKTATFKWAIMEFFWKFEFQTLGLNWKLRGRGPKVKNSVSWGEFFKFLKVGSPNWGIATWAPKTTHFPFPSSRFALPDSPSFFPSLSASSDQHLPTATLLHPLGDCIKTLSKLQKLAGRWPRRGGGTMVEHSWEAIAKRLQNITLLPHPQAFLNAK